MKSEMNAENIRVVATGGLGRLIAENTDEIDVFDPQLTPDGLRLVYEKYKREHRIKPRPKQSKSSKS
jgi:type III pantothenate kinase